MYYFVLDVVDNGSLENSLTLVFLDLVKTHLVTLFSFQGTKCDEIIPELFPGYLSRVDLAVLSGP